MSRKYEENAFLVATFVYTCSCNVRLTVDNVNASRHHESYSLLFRRQVDINLQ